MNAWVPITLGELCDRGGGVVRTGPFGSQLHQKDYSDVGTPVVMPQDLIDGRVSEASIARISDEHVRRLSQHQLKIGDIVYGRRGDIGRRAFITEREEGWLCGTGCLRISPGVGAVNSRFLFYALGEPRTVEGIAKKAVGATMPNLNTTILREVPLLLPTPPEQERIASILGAYDDLIEINRKRIALLEEMARRLFEEWFVCFRYPGHQSDTSKSSVPRGWTTTAIRELGRVVTGKTPSKANPDFFGGTIPFIKIPDMHACKFVLSTDDRLSSAGANSQSSKLIPPGSLCVSCIGTIGLVAITTEPSQTNQQINSIILDREHLREFLFFSLGAAKIALQNLGSTGATMGNVSKDKFEKLALLLPEDSLLHHYHELVAPMFNGMLRYSRMTNALAASRDHILPRVISGEFSISTAERELEAVA